MAHALFVCLHNAGRSQMSQALFERAADGRHTAASAGGTSIGTSETPRGLPLDEVRAIRDDIARKVSELALELDDPARHS